MTIRILFSQLLLNCTDTKYQLFVFSYQQLNQLKKTAAHLLLKEKLLDIFQQIQEHSQLNHHFIIINLMFMIDYDPHMMFTFFLKELQQIFHRGSLWLNLLFVTMRCSSFSGQSNVGSDHQKAC
ncbi:Hypothetical_protein [Hexamita inflata]|uniref:Hypothetical_protein n=1 Tax=Hexamita inflata TaxID=28002 RepID=A0AA86U3C8_9EUKA|nr:Hypothetical protein HINF_LOCUS24152 [Hexamita inflata]